MKQKRSRRQKKMRFWTREKALEALAYVKPVVRSLREQKLEVRAQRRRAKRIKEQPGRPTRDMLIAQEDAIKAARQAQSGYEEAVRELRALNLKCSDPVRGEVLFPFVHHDLLAWYIFDLHDEDGLRHWRYRDDPDDLRRPLSELEEEPTELSEKPKRKPR